VAVLLAPSSQAAGRNCHHLITDPRGNAQEWFLPTKPYNPDADLLYLDAAASARVVDFTLTMASVSAAPTTGTDITVYFHTADQGSPGDWYVDINHAIDGTTYSVQNNLTNQVTLLTGSVDPRAHTYVVHLPLQDIGAYPGRVLTGLGVVVGQTVGTSQNNAGFIEQSTGPGYRYRIGQFFGCR
jgi:hypothetical protein